jgi:hypothetical protein
MHPPRSGMFAELAIREDVDAMANALVDAMAM